MLLISIAFTLACLICLGLMMSAMRQNDQLAKANRHLADKIANNEQFYIQQLFLTEARLHSWKRLARRLKNHKTVLCECVDQLDAVCERYERRLAISEPIGGRDFGGRDMDDAPLNIVHQDLEAKLLAMGIADIPAEYMLYRAPSSFDELIRPSVFLSTLPN